MPPRTPVAGGMSGAARAAGFSQPCSVVAGVLQGESKVRRPGKCCEECVSSEGGCWHDGTARYRGEMWNRTRCDFCVCEEGRVACHEAECATVECAKVRKVFFFQDVTASLGIFFSPLPALREPAFLSGLIL